MITQTLPPRRVLGSAVIRRGFGAINLTQQLQDAANNLIADFQTNNNNCAAYQQPVTAVSSFQSQYNAAGGGAAVNPATGHPGLQVDGLYGPATAAALQEVVAAMGGDTTAIIDPCVAGHSTGGGGGGTTSGGGGGGGGSGGGTVTVPPTTITSGGGSTSGGSQASLVPAGTTVNVFGARLTVAQLLLVGAAGLAMFYAWDIHKHGAVGVHRRMARRLQGKHPHSHKRNPLQSRYRRRKAAKAAKRMARNRKGQFVGKKSRRRKK